MRVAAVTDAGAVLATVAGEGEGGAMPGEAGFGADGAGLAPRAASRARAIGANMPLGKVCRYARSSSGFLLSRTLSQNATSPGAGPAVCACAWPATSATARKSG